MNQLNGVLAKGIKAVGYLPNEDRPAFKMAIHEAEGMMVTHRLLIFVFKIN